MANLQTQVLTSASSAIQGDKASLQSIYYPVQLYPDTEGVTAGCFCWLDTNGSVTANVGTVKPVGFVERNLAHYIWDPKSEGTLVINESEVVTLAVKGSYWAKTSTSATAGQKVFAGKNSIKTGAAGATIADHIETDWVVVTAGGVDDLIIISNF